MEQVKITLAAPTEMTFVWPVMFNWPETAKRASGGWVGGKQVKKTCYLSFMLLPDSEHDQLIAELGQRVSEIAEAKQEAAKLALEVSDDNTAKAKKDLKELNAKVEKLESQHKGFRTELLRKVVVGMPENHGWNAFFSTLPDFSPDLVEAMAGYRVIGKAMEDAYWQLVNGEQPK